MLQHAVMCVLQAFERSHQGYRLRGRTPTQALRETLTIETLPPIIPELEVTTENEPNTLAA